MAEEAVAPADPTAEWYVRANKLNVRLASGVDANDIQAARALARQILDHVRSKVPDPAEFERKVKTSEEYSLTESRQLPKAQKRLRDLWIRAEALAEAADEAEARAKRG